MLFFKIILICFSTFFFFYNFVSMFLSILFRGFERRAFRIVHRDVSRIGLVADCSGFVLFVVFVVILFFVVVVFFICVLVCSWTKALAYVYFERLTVGVGRYTADCFFFFFLLIFSCRWYANM